MELTAFKTTLFVVTIINVLWESELKMSNENPRSGGQSDFGTIFEDDFVKSELPFRTSSDKNDGFTSLFNNCFLDHLQFLSNITFNDTSLSQIPRNLTSSAELSHNSLILNNRFDRKFNCNPVFFERLRECNPSIDDIIVRLCGTNDSLQPMNLLLNANNTAAECLGDSCEATDKPSNETLLKANGTEVSIMIGSLVQLMKLNASIDFREKLKEGLNVVLAYNENLNVMINNGRESTRLLNLAVSLGNTDIVSAMLESGADPGLPDTDGYAALHSCTLQGSVEMMQLLIDSNKTDVNQQAATGETALHLAVIQGMVGISELLLNNGAEPYIYDDKQLTALHIASSINFEIVKKIIAKNKSGIDRTDQYGRTALYMAVKNDLIDTVEFLLMSGSNPNIPDVLGRTPIIISLAEEKEQITIALLKNGADIYYSRNSLRMTPLHLAVQKQQYGVVEMMLKINKEGIDSLNQMEYTPLQMAVMKIDAKMVKILLDNGADPYAFLFGRNWTILHLIADQGFRELGELVLSFNRSGVDYQNVLGQTALYRSVLRNNTDMFHVLLRYGANVTIGTTNKFTPLMVAATHGNLHIVEGILNLTKMGLNDQNIYGETALFVAAKNNHTEIFDKILKRGGQSYIPSIEGTTCLHAASSVRNKRIVQMLLEDNSTIVNIQNLAGETALHIAAEVNDIDLFKYFLTKGADPYIENKEGFTLLHKLVMGKKLDYVDLLLKFNNKGINYSSKTAMTAIYITTVLNDSPMFKLLMKYGADPYVADAFGRNALHNAAFQKQTEIVEHLLSISRLGINMQDSEGYTALHFGSGNPRICEILLKYGADIFLASNNGMTALHNAVDVGALESVILLLAENSSLAEVKDDNDQIALHFAVAGNDSDIFDTLLNSTGNPFEKNIIGLTPMHIASERGHKNYVELLLKLNNSYVNHPAYDGHTGLHYATSKNHTEVVELLLQAGADPRVFDYSGYTSYHYAVLHDLPHLLELFFEKNSSDVNIETVDGTTLVAMAARNGHKDIVDMLLEKSVNLSTTNDFGRTILHSAIAGRNEEILLKLLNKTVHLINQADIEGNAPIHLATEIPHFFNIIFSNGGDPFIPYLGYTPLHFAAFKGYKEIIETILDKYSECVGLKSNIGLTSLEFAHFGKSREAAKLLIDQGADIFSSNFFDENVLHYSNTLLDNYIIENIIIKEMNKTVNRVLFRKALEQRNAHGLTPIVKAAVYGNENVFQTLRNAGCSFDIISIWKDSILHFAAKGGNENIIRTVLNETYIPVGSKNYHGVTPLMKAADSGIEAAFDVLLQKGASLQDVTRYNETILHFAAMGGNVRIIGKALTSKSVRIDAADFEGYTPLMLACIHGHKETVQILMLEGADPDIRNIYDESPISYAAMLGRNDILNLFIYTTVQYDSLLGFVLTKNEPLNEDFIKYLLHQSTISKHPLFIAAALGDDVALLKALKLYPLSRKIRFPHLMKQLMKEYDAILEELLVEEPLHLTGYENYITPLDVALLFFGKMSTVKLIIDYFQISINAVQKQRSMWSPLDLAMCSMVKFPTMQPYKKQILYFLLNAEKMYSGLSNVYGWTISHKAAWFGNGDVIQLLKKRGVDLQKSDKYGRTPLHIAALKGYKTIVELILRDSKENINSGDLYGFTPLHLVQVYGRRKFFTRLSFAKSDMDIQDRFAVVEKVDPMDSILGARTRSYLDTMILLIESGADVNAQDHTFGWTPLHWAAINGDMWKTVTLVGKGAKPNRPSRTGVTPLFLARSWGRVAIYHYLKLKEGVW